MVAEMVFGILAMMIIMGFSCWQEFRADKGGVAIAGRENIIHALQRLQTTKDNPKLPDEMAALSFNAGRVQALFSSHPPFEKRIAALMQANITLDNFFDLTL
jgi:heat shock protein HtpX